MEKVSLEKAGGADAESKTRPKYLRRPTMKLNLSTEGLARASGRRPWTTIGVWVVVLVAAMVLTGTLLGDALTLEDTLTNNPESVRADNLLHERLGESNNTIGEMVIVRSTTLTVDDPAYRSYVEELYGDLTDLGDEVVAGGTHYYFTGDESWVSADRRTTIMPLVIPEGAKEEINQVHQVVDKATENGSFQVLITGEATLDAEVIEMAEKDLAIGEGIGISVALVVLALVFGAVVAAVLSIVLAVVAIIVALGATAVVGQAFDLSFIVTQMVSMTQIPHLDKRKTSLEPDAMRGKMFCCTDKPSPTRCTHYEARLTGVPVRRGEEYDGYDSIVGADDVRGVDARSGFEVVGGAPRGSAGRWSGVDGQPDNHVADTAEPGRR